jgi:hypothetical protein
MARRRKSLAARRRNKHCKNGFRKGSIKCRRRPKRR